ncbi:MAG: hypothetical protein COV98_00025 [Candidatus Altarchaeum sp. CG12_big_fil_rev_8_21_14_0_65_33_22]|nr:MAG: hypothetical protein COV98_00025 [Candidatus Altarchaeum sp. CG12_big_fil_rev_8_21_14_0_65_33_22]
MFTGESTYQEVIAKEESYKILAKHGVPCVTCPMARYEMGKLKLGSISEMYGLDLKALLDDLNKIK